MTMYKISAEDARKIRKEMKRTEKAGIYKKLQAVALRGEGLTNDEIAAITKYNSNYVGELCKLYVTAGLEGLKADGRKGGNNRNMNDAEAAEFLEQFEEEAKKGQIITVADIAKAYDEATGKERESQSTVYYFLHKHGWRLVSPKRQHPGKASDEEIEASKKLTLKSRK